jgi:type II secretory pathway pseudopilin PulG
MGLTLIELLVVLTVLGFVAATVTMRLGGRLGHAALAQSVSQWKFTDSQLRTRAARKGRSIALHLEVGSNQLELALDPEDDGARTVRSLGRGVTLTRYRSATREITYGPIAIDYSSEGTTETYAVELTGSQGARWVLVAGLTGQATEVANGDDIDELLDQLLPSSLHAG